MEQNVEPLRAREFGGTTSAYAERECGGVPLSRIANLAYKCAVAAGITAVIFMLLTFQRKLIMLQGGFPDVQVYAPHGQDNSLNRQNGHNSSVQPNLLHSPHKGKLAEGELMDSSEMRKSNDTMASNETLRGLLECVDIRPRQHVGQRGGYWVIYNFVLARRQFKCWESVTYTTHGDFTFLDNLETLLSRWKGPISLALYAPGTDFNRTLSAIKYLRYCGNLVDLVTFHVYFPAEHLPDAIPKSKNWWDAEENCSALHPPWANSSTYRADKKLLYPINVGRNIAIEMASTHFILASDIELYPSPGVIEGFLEMIRRNDRSLQTKNPKVFPLPVFEIVRSAILPTRKTELVQMLKDGTAVRFHRNICDKCHRIPHYSEWVEAKSTDENHLGVFHIGQRKGKFKQWEPFYIGTRHDPHFDERLSWEGESDKMTQAYALCVLGYEFHILDNAFLVHKPGIKRYHFDPARQIHIDKTDSHMRKIRSEMNIIYGVKKECHIS